MFSDVVKEVGYVLLVEKAVIHFFAIFWCDMMALRWHPAPITPPLPLLDSWPVSPVSPLSWQVTWWHCSVKWTGPASSPPAMSRCWADLCRRASVRTAVWHSYWNSNWIIDSRSYIDSYFFKCLIGTCHVVHCFVDWRMSLYIDLGVFFSYLHIN